MDFRRELLSAKSYQATKKKKAGNLFKEIINDNYILGQSLLFKRAYVKDISFDARLKYLNDYRFMVDLASEHVFSIFLNRLLNIELTVKSYQETARIG